MCTTKGLGRVYDTYARDSFVGRNACESGISSDVRTFSQRLLRGGG